MKILDGKKAALHTELELSKKIKKFSRKPELAILVVGERADSKAYIAQKCRMADRLGARVRLFSFPENISEKKVVEEIDSLNQNENVDGIILQLPLPANHSPRKIIDHISPKKDVDGLTSVNQGRLLVGEKAFVPATARGVLSLLKFYKIPLSGKKVVVLGRSLLVGRPTSLMVEREGATVTVCHSKTRELSKVTKEADVLIVAIGRPKFIKKNFVSKKQTVVDVGISVIEKKNKKTFVGDVDFQNVEGIVKAISPVPGGVGPMTVVSLFANLCDAYTQNNK